jgi:aryl-alcohol dehydrogenase-like predicted oxidoreductase
VVGPRRPEHLENVHEALSLSLSQAEREEVGSFFGC